jgi:2-oxoglutarate ferredoxin oxidoreductase subunit gamma
MSLEIEKVVIAGHAAHGIHFLGRILAQAGMMSGCSVTWLPPYGPIILAGNATGTVILSSVEVGSPVVEVPDALIALNPHAFDLYNRRLKAGGLLLYDISQMRAENQFRDDIRTIGIPSLELSPVEPGLLTPSISLLGAYVACSKMVKLSVAVEALREVLREEGFTGAADYRVNRRAMERGASFVGDKKYMYYRYRYSIFTG